jgi:hypothetical protein
MHGANRDKPGGHCCKRYQQGSEVTSTPLPGFPHGLFVAMSNGRVFHYYAWEDLAGKELARAGPATGR